MTDLEMTKLCAEAMKFVHIDMITKFAVRRYDPLYDDAQAMALVKRFQLWIGGWIFDIVSVSKDGQYLSTATSLNRAIVECVAKMQANAPD